MYAKNLQSFLGLFINSTGTLVEKRDDEILLASLLVGGHEIRYAPTRELLGVPR
jgi:hypothetical protein